MYIISFLENLKRRHNWGIITYLILNVFLCFFIIYAPSTSSPYALLDLFYLIIFGLILYAVPFAIMLSPVGEFFLRLRTGAGRIKRKDLELKLKPLFDHVYQKAKSKDPSLPEDIQIFFHKSPVPNAFATGRKTICVTEGLLGLPEEEIEAILAHEFGHLSNKDTDITVAILVGNVFFNVILFFFTVFLAFAGFLFFILLFFILKDDAFSLYWKIVRLPQVLWTKIGMMFVRASYRQAEFEADRFAAEIGYASELASALDRISDQSPDIGILRAIYATHPETDERVGKLQELGADYSAY